MQDIKLNLGCFDRKIPGFINIDIREEANPDVIDNAFVLSKIKDNTVDLIYCCHMLEHLDYKETEQAIKVWYRKLKDGGKLRLAVPDLEAICALFLLTKDKNLLKSSFWGSQRHDFDYHKNGWHFDSLKEELEKYGFSNIIRWDWQTTSPHNYIDDYSQAYWPPMHKKYICSNGKEVDLGGKLISLNIEATK